MSRLLLPAELRMPLRHRAQHTENLVVGDVRAFSRQSREERTG
ncbi:hypothetical protein [Streptomyces capillispiralis]|nr:hypothetical protein [Streptomyces capillispiralis]